MNAWASVPTGNGPIGVARRSRRRIAGVAITGLVAATFAAGVAAPAQAALPGPVGGTDEVNGFPLSYSDGTITLGQCLDGPQCVGTIEKPNPALPASYPENFPIEQFWFHASTGTDAQPGLYEAALEGAYLETTGAGTPADPFKGVAGSEVAFGRIRIILDNVVPDATYQIQHPYGEVTIQDNSLEDEIKATGTPRSLRITIDNGCLVTPCNVAGPTGFDAAAAGFLGNVAGNPPSTFLRQANTAGPGFLGDVLVPGPVTGAPSGLNAVTATGPNVGGPNVDTITALNFGVSGMIAAPPVAPSAPLTPTVTPGIDSALVSWTAPSNGGSPMTTYSVQAFTVTGAPLGAPQIVPAATGTRANSLNVTGLTTGTKVAFEVQATNLIGTSAVSARSAVVIPGTPTQQYVGRVYSDLFNRAPDPTGLAFWTAKLDTGTPRVAVANAITNSTEYRSTLITGSYQKYLGRAPDAGGLSANLTAMSKGMTVSQMESGFISSPEYFIKAGSTNALWVQQLYMDVLGRSAGPTEVSFWTTHLGAGMSRSQVSMGFLLSAERLGTVVDEYYLKFLARNLDPTGRATWVKMLQAGGRNETIIGGIIASPEYFSTS